MKTSCFFTKMVLCGLVMVLAMGSAHAVLVPRVATVRGRLVHKKGGAAAAGLTVTISNQQGVRSAPAQTGPAGMYYLPNIAPGQDYLEIWRSTGSEPLLYKITVKAPSTDLPQIAVP
jgi:hypothetical protein